MEFGVQAFNIFNHVQLGDPNTDNPAFDYDQVSSTAEQDSLEGWW
jgi:hypothetical protein